jgi:uncharacterized protein (TIRG00374 family)
MKYVRRIFNGIFRGFLGVLISGVFIWLAFRTIDIHSVVQRLQNVQAEPIILCLVGQFIFQILHWLRWGLLLRQMGDIRWGQIFIMGAIGNAALYILPMRSGEIVRPTLAARKDQINLGQASATSLVERLVDGFLVCGILFASLIAISGGAISSEVHKSGFLFLAFLLGGSVILLFGSIYEEKVEGILQRFVGRVSTRWAEMLIGFYEGLIQGIKLLSKRQILVRYIGLSIALWLIDIISIYWLFGILREELPFITAGIVISFLALGSLIPSGPIQLGVFEFSIVLGLSIFSVPSEDAVLLATLFHLILISLVSVVGILSFWLDRMKLVPD